MVSKTDALRYFWLYNFGGIYADIDYYCYKSFKELFE